MCNSELLWFEINYLFKIISCVVGIRSPYCLTSLSTVLLGYFWALTLEVHRGSLHLPMRLAFR